MSKQDIKKELTENELDQLKEIEQSVQACSINKDPKELEEKFDPDKNTESIEEKLKNVHAVEVEACGINKNPVELEKQVGESQENLNSIEDKLKNVHTAEVEACGINKNPVELEKQVGEGQENLNSIEDKLKNVHAVEVEACGINKNPVGLEEQVDSSSENLDNLKDKLKNIHVAEVQACGINKNPENLEKEVDNSKLASLEEKLKNVHAAEVEACGINKNPENLEKQIGSNKKEIAAPRLPHVDGENVDRSTFNILDTYGYNVPVTEAVRQEIIEELSKEPRSFEVDNEIYIKVLENGPYLVFGDVPIMDDAIEIDKTGQSIGWDDQKDLKSGKVVALCRCGHSNNMPFCDGNHEKFHFVGKCTADNIPYDDAAKIYEGCPGAYLMDEESLCAIVRFCDPDGSCWNLIKDAKTLDHAIEESFNCASGRLTVVKDGKRLEPKLEKSIEAIYDTEKKELGPLWVKGGIPVKTDKVDYEVRNRQTLCRCGRSYNKPFCDGMHLTCPTLTDEEILANE